MKLVLIAGFLFCFGCASNRQHEPDTTNYPDGVISAIAAKFCDVYSDNPAREASFSIGSSIVEELRKDGFEEIRIICLDGFVKVFSISPRTEKKVKKIDYLGKTKGIIHYSDGSTSISETLTCPSRPVIYQVIRKRER